jgi:bidirectional [NiFe] hydrogenase diaphorase subunit
MGTACYVKRAAEIVAALQAAYGVEAGHTTPDGKLSILTARCLGSCGLAPVLVVDGEVLARETPETTLKFVQELVSGARAQNGRHAPTVTAPAPQEDDNL